MSEKALLDTDLLSLLMRDGDDQVRLNAERYLQQQQRLTFSVITRYEILRGLHAKGATRQIESFHEFCRVSEVLPIDDQVALHAAEIYGHLHRAGSLIGDADILIAATTLVHNCLMVTGNVRHFARIPGLRLVDWRQAQ